MCHTMHNSIGGYPADPSSPGGNPSLLLQSMATDLCLTCHSGHMGNVFGGDPLAPPDEVGAGNFVFLLEDNLNDRPGGSTITGDAAGHNVVSFDRNVQADETLQTAPGGTFPSEHLGCTSCHDPHGSSSFRMLYGDNMDVQGGLYTFDYAAPSATGLSIYHGRESNTRHSAYNSGVSEWCGNCHDGFLQQHSETLHPIQGVLTAEIIGT